MFSHSVVGIEFKSAFEALTGYAPLKWQRKFFKLMVSGHIPRCLDLPTGLGKTSVITLWLIALCQQVVGRHITLPRRLVYIVNRRTVVDQATTTVDQIRERLLQPNDSAWSEHAETLETLTTALQALSPEPPILAVSTLRGELVDNEEWKTDPARAAIIVGTIDMIGSKLLFSGYGDGLYSRPHHAGLIGQDALIVHDEAHLTPTFCDLLRGVSDAQRADCEPRPICVLELSATQRIGDGREDVLQLEADDEQDTIVIERIDAKKWIRLHHADTNKARNLCIAELAHTKHNCSRTKVLIYVRFPEDAKAIADLLKKLIGDRSDDRVALLTGTIRGYERDRLVTSNPVYRQLLDAAAQLEETVYLVSTSAGEVGIDIDADHMICDLTTLDSMVQRLGRVNRRGGNDREAQVDLVWTKQQVTLGHQVSEFDKAVVMTKELLDRWKNGDGMIDASPRCVRKQIDKLDTKELTEAFSPKPVTSKVTDILLDAWSLTSVDDVPGRPDVAQYLHGQTSDPPETYVAWRKEVELFQEGRYDLDDKVVSRWFRICPVRSLERVTAPTSKVVTFLKSLRKGLGNCNSVDEYDTSVVVLDSRFNAERRCLSDLSTESISYKTVLLPLDVGGLGSNGELDAKTLEPAENMDVADMINHGMERRRIFPSDTFPLGWKERGSVTLRESQEGAEDEAPEIRLSLAMPDRSIVVDNHELSQFDQTLREHTSAIVQSVKDIGSRLELDAKSASALALACGWHDRGKDRTIWQRYARKEGSVEPYAKSLHYLHGRALVGYRHELGSLLDAIRDIEVNDHPEHDLILHLIASHHGHARPHFKLNAADRERYSTRSNAEAASEVSRRFARLQRQYGRWGLAWLEALMRCADIAASQPPNRFEELHVEERIPDNDVQTSLI